MSSQELLYLIGTLCLLIVSGFLCWALYELATLLHQANEVVGETRVKITKVEETVRGLTDKLMNVSQYLGLIAEGAKSVFALVLGRDREEKEARSKHKKLSELPEG